MAQINLLPWREHKREEQKKRISFFFIYRFGRYASLSCIVAYDDWTQDRPTTFTQ